MTTNKEKTQGMPISSVVAEWLEFSDSNVKMEVAEDKSRSTTADNADLKEATHYLYIESEDNQDYLTIYLYPPHQCPPKRMADLYMILNRINSVIWIGKLTVLEGSEQDNKPTLFSHCVDVSNSSVSVQMIDLIINKFADYSIQYYDLLSAICYTNQPVEQLWQEFLESQVQDEVPDAL